MPEIPPESVTEEEYVDEHGHTVTRKVLSGVSFCAAFKLPVSDESVSSHCDSIT